MAFVHVNSAKQVTILMDDVLFEKLRSIHSKRIEENNKQTSFSRTLNQLLEDALNKK